MSNRLDEVIRAVTNGLSRTKILQLAEGKSWTESTEEIDQLIDQATQFFVQASNLNLDAQFGIAIVRLDDLYQRCLTVQDYKTALASEKERLKLLKDHRKPTARTAPKIRIKDGLSH